VVSSNWFSTTQHRPRECEVGMLTVKTKFTFYLSFCDFPVWLLSLESVDVQLIYFIDFSNLDECITYIRVHTNQRLAQLAKFLVHRVGISRCRFGVSNDVSATVEPTVISLFSGNFMEVCRFLGTQTASSNSWGLVNHMFCGRLHGGRPSGSTNEVLRHTRWCRVRHTTVGGPTNYCALLGYTGLHVEPKLTILRRNIRSILDFGIRPRVCTGPCQSDASSSIYCLQDKLITGFYDRLVVLPTSFTSTGWGSRVLTSAEIAKAHGMPAVLANREDLDQQVFTYPPVNIMDAFIQGFSSSHTQLRQQTNTPVAVPPHTTSTARNTTYPKQSWIPALGCFLAHDWIDDSLVTAKAVKHDNATTPSQLWDARLIQIFPHCASALTVLRTRLLIRYRRRVYKEAVHHLHEQYGKRWYQLFVAGAARYTASGGS
jgi:hypothetical protein